MSDSKRTGSRDISDLKQRLGLKKAGGAPGTGTGSNRAIGQSGGVVAPPGMNLPPPPGHQQSQPIPVAPNAADDPFGAMNHMAAVGNVQRAPEIIIVNDGRPVENVGSSSMGATLAKIAIPAIAMLGIGVGIGRVSKDANFYNDGLKDARAILGEPGQASTLRSVKKLLSEVDSTLDDMKTKSQYRPDVAIDKKLTELAGKLDVKSELVFRAKQNSLDAETAGQILLFYSGVAEVKGMLDAHVKAAKADDLALATGKRAGDAALIKEGENALLNERGFARYGVVMSAPTEDDKNNDFGARLVELGPPYCADKLSTTGKCENEGVTGFAYRDDPGANWTKGDLIMTGSDNVPAKKLVPLLANGIRDAVIKGGEAGASEVYYVKRVRAIADRAKKLITDANRLETILQSQSSKGARFSFFL